MVRFTMRKLILSLIFLAGSVTAETNPALDCWCRGSSGERFEMGDITCFTISGRTFTAQCQMSLNNTMWRELSEGCLSA
ncbi:MAG: hypothetical protein AAGH73_09710 [Pseudomonadota bacterium]